MAGYRRYSLRTLVIFVTVLTVWIGLTSLQANRQRRAVEGLQSRGAQLEYAHEFTFDAKYGPVPQREVPNAPLPGPDWLRGIVGNDYFITPVKLWISDQNWDNADHLAVLDDLPDLEAIYLFGVRFRNSDTEHFGRLKKLKVLMLRTWTLPSDEPIHDFDFLSNFPHLVHLSLPGLPFEDADATCLKSAPELLWLQLENTHLGDAGLAELGHLSKLEFLNVSRTRITDDGLSRIAALQNIKSLDLSNTAITDEGVEHLKRITGLQTLTLAGTKITAEGIATLRKALPKAIINTKER